MKKPRTHKIKEDEEIKWAKCRRRAIQKGSRIKRWSTKQMLAKKLEASPYLINWFDKKWLFNYLSGHLIKLRQE